MSFLDLMYEELTCGTSGQPIIETGSYNVSYFLRSLHRLLGEVSRVCLSDVGDYVAIICACPLGQHHNTTGGWYSHEAAALLRSFICGRSCIPTDQCLFSFNTVFFQWVTCKYPFYKTLTAITWRLCARDL